MCYGGIEIPNSRRTVADGLFREARITDEEAAASAIGATHTPRTLAGS